MLTVHKSTATDFNNNGLAVLTNITKAEVTEIMNSDFKVTLTYPLIDKKSRYLTKYNVIKAMTPKGYNIFRIEKSRRSDDGNSVECICVHESYYSLARNFLRDVRPTNTNGLGALTWMKDHAESPVKFNFKSDIDKINTAYYIRKNFLDAIMGEDDNSFLKVWGGELDRGIDTIGIYKQLGEDRKYKVAEAKNLINIEESTEGTEVTRLMVTGRDENDNVLELPEVYVDSPLINNYPEVSFKHIDFPNIKVSRSDAVTDYADKEAVYTELRRQAALLYSEQNIDRPSVNFTINFADLSKTDAYKNIKALQQLYLGDIVTIHSKKLGIDIKARLISYTYDCVLQKYTKLELGDYVKSDYTASNILNNKIVTVATDNYVIGNKLKQALGGHVIKREGEILICDTDNIATATKVWRFNLNGLGYSSTGYNGDYGIAITMDGEIVANFIKTGELDASLIKVGVISSKNNLTWINMENGTFNFAGKIKWDGTSFTVDGSIVTGEIKSKDGTVDINLDNGSFRIGGGSGDVAEHSNSQSIWKHSNGSYSKADANGFFNYIGDTGRAYHHLIATDVFTYNLSENSPETQTTTIHLPSEFLGKEVAISCAISEIAFNQYPTFLSYFFVDIKNFNKNTATFDIVSGIYYYNPGYYPVANGVMAYTSSTDRCQLLYTIQWTASA